jgi:catechol 2,3-dioxygenase-like lactoylglutathione lyase family enzyme
MMMTKLVTAAMPRKTWRDESFRLAMLLVTTKSCRQRHFDRLGYRAYYRDIPGSMWCLGTVESIAAGAFTFMTRANTQAISPFFIVSNVKQTITFYCDKLGFETRFREPDRNPFFAIIGRDGAQILIKSDKDVSPLPNSKRHPSMRWDAFVYAPNPDALAAEFSDYGATFSAPLTDTHDGLRGFEICDPDGYILFFGRPCNRPSVFDDDGQGTTVHLIP